MTIEDMRAVIQAVAFEDYEFLVLQSHTGFIYLVGEYDEADTVTGIVERQRTRRWLLSPEMTRSEIVSTAFKLCMTSVEHRTREWFLYRGRAIYQPHYDVDELYEIAERTAKRDAQGASLVSGLFKADSTFC